MSVPWAESCPQNSRVEVLTPGLQPVPSVKDIETIEVCPASHRSWAMADVILGNCDGPAPALKTGLFCTSRKGHSTCLLRLAPVGNTRATPSQARPHTLKVTFPTPGQQPVTPPAGVILALGKVVPEKPTEESASCLRRPCWDADAAPTGSNYAPGKMADPACKAGPVSFRTIHSRVGTLRTVSRCDGHGPVPGTWAQRWACLPVGPRGSVCVAGPAKRGRQTRSL